MTGFKFPDSRLAPGIYLGLPEKPYHEDSALGSTDIRTLRKGPHLYWHRSWMNPLREPFDDDITPARIMGKAIHKQLLEGGQAFTSVFIRRPPDDEGATSAEKSALTKEWNKKLRDGQHLLKSGDWDFVMDCGRLIEAHPDLSKVLSGGLREVSVVWDRVVTTGEDTDDRRPVTARCKARFDLLKPRGIGDLKSIANELDLPLKQACRRAFENHRYGLQAEHYMDGRRQIGALLRAGAVHFMGVVSNDDKDATLTLLRQCAAEKQFAFQIIFIPKNGDPNCASWTLSPGNPILEYERRCIDDALLTYASHLESYGTDRWPLEDRVEEMAIEELSSFYGRET
jgi:PDDEXK-like domain of unknown function (DUF3799)